MGYNTRRKSISLEALGVLSSSAAAANSSQQQNHARPQSKNTRTVSAVRVTSPQRPAKRLKQRHTYEPTPPPSPPLSGPDALSTRPSDGEEDHQELRKEDDDAVVEAVLQILRAGKERSYSIRDLAEAIECRELNGILNPSAVITSHVNSYLKRCSSPLLKKAERTSHSRRTYLHLASMPSPPGESSDDENADEVVIDVVKTEEIDKDEPRHQGLFRRSPSPDLEFDRLDGLEKSTQEEVEMDLEGLQATRFATGTPEPERIDRPSLEPVSLGDEEEQPQQGRFHLFPSGNINQSELGGSQRSVTDDGNVQRHQHDNFTSAPTPSARYDVSEWLDFDSPEQMGLDELDHILGSF